MSTSGWKLSPAQHLARFWKRTKAVGQCIEWTGAATGDHRRYGRYRGTSAHRWIYERVVGSTNGMELLHSCDNHACVKLQHLEPGTHAQNMADAAARKRMAPKHGHLNGRAKINDAAIFLIRHMATRGSLYADIAHAFGLAITYISHVVHRARIVGVV